MPDIKQRAREMAKKRFRQFPALRDGTWKLSTDLSIFYDFIDEIIDIAVAERDKEIKEFDEYEFLRGLGLNDGDTMNAEEIGDVCEQMKQRLLSKPKLSAEALNIK